MADAFLGQVMLFAGNFAPQGWHFCDGSLLNISQSAALYSLLGNTYGGNGTTNFALPDLRGRVAVGAGAGPGLSNYAPGQQNGTENVTLNTNQIPSHNHALVASNTQGADTSPSNDYLAQVVDSTNTICQAFAGSPTTVNMNSGSIGPAGGSQAHTNIQPSMGMNYIICVNGIYPPRS